MFLLIKACCWQPGDGDSWSVPSYVSRHLVWNSFTASATVVSKCFGQINLPLCTTDSLSANMGIVTLLKYYIRGYRISIWWKKLVFVGTYRTDKFNWELMPAFGLFSGVSIAVLFVIHLGTSWASILSIYAEHSLLMGITVVSVSLFKVLYVILLRFLRY